MNKVLVLGGTGFLGTQVMRLAREQGYDPVSLSLEAKGRIFVISTSSPHD